MKSSYKIMVTCNKPSREAMQFFHKKLADIQNKNIINKLALKKTELFNKYKAP